MGKDSPRFDSMDEETVCKSIPISYFKSSTLSKKMKLVLDGGDSNDIPEF
jgi:hypothetical protein